MTVTIAFADANDGYVTTGSPTNWDDALNGNAAGANNGFQFTRYGAEYTFGIWWAYQSFFQFPYSRPANQIEVGVDIGVQHVAHYGAVSRQMQMHFLGTGTGLPTWGPPVDAADWVNPLGVLLTQRGVRVFDVQASGTSQYVYAGSNLLTNRLRTYGSTSYSFMTCTDRQLIYGLYPTDQEFSEIWTAESSLDPVMVVTSVPVSTLYNVLGAQVQTPFGTWAAIESNGATPPTLTLKHIDTAGTATTIATLSGFAVSGYGITNGAGSQQVALTVDNDGNLYVTGGWATLTNSIAVQAYKIAGPGIAVWTGQTPLAGGLPYSEADANNFTVTWHNTGGGTLVAMVGRGSSDGWHVASSELCWVVMSGAQALAGNLASSPLIRSSGVAVGTLSPALSQTSWSIPANDTGTELDVTALSPTKGIVAGVSRYDRLGNRQPVAKGRYTLDAAGTTITSAINDLTAGQAGATWAVKTASGKVRVVAISEDTFAVVTADTVGGISVGVIRNTGTSGTFTTLGWMLLSPESLTTMPTGTTLSDSQAWDVIYLKGPNKLWIYYFDVTNGRRLMRTGINLNTYLATREEVQVSATVGAVGSTNLALRVARTPGGTTMAATQRRVLVTVANRTSGGALSTVYLVDTPNEAPAAPILQTHVNYDATTASTFNWIHYDPDYGDAQTQYQIDINTSLGVDVYDSGTVVSGNQFKVLPGGTLTNPGSYQWRVRTWDEAGLVSPWSAYQTFTTAAGGTVVITDPATDNPPNVITATYPVTWTLTGAVQAAYHAVVKNNATNAIAYDSGWVTSTATTAIVTGLTSDVTYRIEVTTRTSGAVDSNTGTRLITASYSAPDLPGLTVLPHDSDGYTLVAVSNPPTSGDRPDVVHNEIRRRIKATTTAATGPWVSIGATALGGTWKDYTASGNVTYEYQAIAVAADGSYQLSVRTPGTLCLSGVWIHDPADPAHADESAHHYTYGGSGKSDNVEVVAEATYYAGREYPVFDWGDGTTETVKVPIQVPAGDLWLGDITILHDLPRQRRTLCFRDARARRIFGAVTAITRNDETYGTSVEFTITAVSFLELYQGYGPPITVIGDGPGSDSDLAPADWDGGGIFGGTDATIDGGDVCGGEPVCVGDVSADGGGA